MKKTIFIISVTILTVNCFAQPGTLDNTFGTGGKVTTSIGSYEDNGRSVAIQADGKIVVAGSSSVSSMGNNFDFALVRYNSTGTLDSTFGTGGKVTTDIGSDDRGYSVAIQADGKIVVAGYTYNGSNLYDFALVRYTGTGILDNTFGMGGKVTTSIGSSDDYGYSVAIQADGKIVVAGTSLFTGFALVRYDSTGSLDNTFGTGGKVTTAIGSGLSYGFSVAIQTDGKIVMAGYSPNGGNNDFALVRYTSTGSLDNTFGSGGKVITAIGGAADEGSSVAIQTDGKIVVAGMSNNGTNRNFALARYTGTGSLDNTFGSGGKVTTTVGSYYSVGHSVAMQADGNIVVSGHSYNGNNYDFDLVCYTGTGSLDNTFSSGGIVNTPLSGEDIGYSVVIQADGKIVVAGSSGDDFAVVRYNGAAASGINTVTEQTTGINISPNPTTGIIQVIDNEYSIIGVEIYNVQGEKIYSNSKFNKQTSNEIDLSKFSKGIYFVKIYNEKNSHTEKIVVQ